MGFLEKLSAIVSIKNDLSKLKDLTIKLIGDKNTVGLINVTKNEIHLNVNSDEIKDPEKRKQVLALIRDEVHIEERPVLEAQASEVVRQISSVTDDSELLDYFKGKIPSTDLAILRAALLVRGLHRQGKPVDGYLSDIRYRYGQHGANIANLCSAGYFESYIQPMYEELSTRPNFDHEMFAGNYKLIVDSAPFAVFVNRSDSVEDLLTQVVQKLEFNKMYGLKRLNIHGIGHDNVEKIEKLLRSEPLQKHFTSDPERLVEGNVINATIFY
jgi:hypothetical protein